MARNCAVLGVDIEGSLRLYRSFDPLELRFLQWVIEGVDANQRQENARHEAAVAKVERAVRGG